MNALYRSSLALLTDLYELTMAYGYWKSAMSDFEAVFHVCFRKKPFNGGFAIASGLQAVIDFLQNFHFSDDDLGYLATLKGGDNQPLFETDFLHYLSQLRFTCDVDAVVEGDVIFPYEPLIRVQGPLLLCQLMESALLTLTNFSTLISTKASRMALAAKGEPILEFGLRRAQGIDGSLTASRAAFIGGCSATSNVLAGKLWKIPVSGTMAHSWVMAFDSELEAFKTFALAMPTNTVFLVDTFDSLEGVKHAIEIGRWLHERGQNFLGVRLDSGDLAYLSIESRKLLDEAGFKNAVILASNELDEALIADLKTQGAAITMWGVGTNLVTGGSQGALDGVYKLSALRKNESSKWDYKLKLSEHMTKVSNPGILQVKRYFHPSMGYVGDAIYDVHVDLKGGCTIIDPLDKTRRKKLSDGLTSRDMLQPIFRKGKLVYQSPSLQEIQAYAKEELGKFDKSIKRFYNPHTYPVGLEKSLYDLKIALVEKIREKGP
jgi:nicotinate phosphoribosyltransferase